MTAFFIPGVGSQPQASEDAYGELRSAVELATGQRPSARRILQVWSRRGGADCRTEVGRPDPVHGDTVLAIFDLGPGQPFVVHCRPPTGALDGIREVLSAHTYSVTEFDG